LEIQKSFQLKLFLGGGGGKARMWAQQSQHRTHQYNKNRNIPGKENTIFRHRCFMRKKNI
jgi:hypothetical protein